MKKLLSGIAAVCLLLCAWAPVRAETVSLTFNRDSLYLSVGRYVTLYVEVVPAGALREGAIFTVSDDTIASVNEDGKVRGLQVGQCELTATSKYDSTVSATIPVFIIVPVSDLKIQADETAVVMGQTLQLSVAVEPENATMQGVRFSSSDEDILTVSADGLVTGISRGQATVTAQSADGRATVKQRITVKLPPDSVTVTPETISVAEGQTAQLTATVLPKDTDNKTVLWFSADATIATVSDRGVVTGVQLGETEITAVCKDNADATYTIPVTVLKLAERVAFDQESYDVLLGDTIRVSSSVYPASTSNQSVTYEIENTRIASVDEYGLVTSVRGGTTTITAKATDGSRKSASATLNVQVPVTGVSYPRTDIRVGDRKYGHFTVDLEPADATNINMTWTIADPTVATVTGDTTTFRIDGGEDWGRTAVTGITEDGGYEVSINVNIGSLYRAVTVRGLKIVDEKPYITLQNNSNMTITQVRYYLRGLDSSLQPLQMSYTGDLFTLYGTYDMAMYPGERTQYDLFSFFAPTDFSDLSAVYLLITGWSTSTGFYDTQYGIEYEYTIPNQYLDPSIYPSGTDPALF